MDSNFKTPLANTAHTRVKLCLNEDQPFINGKEIERIRKTKRGFERSHKANQQVEEAEHLKKETEEIDQIRKKNEARKLEKGRQNSRK